MNIRTDYAIGQKVLHWLMALLIMLDLVVAQKFGDYMEEWDRLASRSDHASLGTIVTALFIIRIVLRLRYGAPPLNPDMSLWQTRLAHWAPAVLFFDWSVGAEWYCHSGKRGKPYHFIWGVEHHPWSTK